MSVDRRGFLGALLVAPFVPRLPIRLYAPPAIGHCVTATDGQEWLLTYADMKWQRVTVGP